MCTKISLKGRWIQKRQFLKTEGFSLSIRIYNADVLSISIYNALTSDNPIEPA